MVDEKEEAAKSKMGANIAQGHKTKNQVLAKIQISKVKIGKIQMLNWSLDEVIPTRRILSRLTLSRSDEANSRSKSSQLRSELSRLDEADSCRVDSTGRLRVRVLFACQLLSECDFKPDADSRCLLPSIRIHLGIKDRFHSCNFEHNRRVIQARKFEIDDELLQTFNKVEINILLLDAIRQISKYAKFLKELCTNKRNKLKGNVEVGRNVLALIQSKQVYALIQPVVPKKSLRFSALEPMGIVIQLANRSIAHLLGILEDMLVQVSDMILQQTSKC
ncbi:hypothetical protein CR513_43755, partial [Mucuna pruriens]